MERLVKNLADVVLGDHEDSDPQEARDERSRSTWAQVVSADPEGEDECRGEGRRRPPGQISHGGNPHGDQWDRPAVHQDNENGEDRRQHDYSPNRKETEEGKDTDGWQPAHKKHLKRPQQVHMDHWGSYKQPASEQEYSNEVEDGARIEPSEEELSDISRACSKLWGLDINRLVPGKDYEIECGRGKKVYNKDDVAEECLFTWLGDDVLRRPTISRFFALLDNYNPHEGYKEVITQQEKQEQIAFIEEISRTAPIKYLYRYLVTKRIFSGDYRQFKEFLTDHWFTLYGRGGTAGSSSAFEHVFVGEIKNRGEEQVCGFHNWIQLSFPSLSAIQTCPNASGEKDFQNLLSTLQFYLEEAKGRVDYQGYILPRKRGEHPDSETQLLTIQFEWNGVLKSVSSSFIGVSPEFEVALYTLCFFAGREDNYVELGPYQVNVKCYRLGNKIGSVFPIAES